MIADPGPTGSQKLRAYSKGKTTPPQAVGEKFFNENLKPNLPPGVVPDLRYYELHAVFTR
jgi:hypothetical protein